MDAGTWRGAPGTDPTPAHPDPANQTPATRFAADQDKGRVGSGAPRRLRGWFTARSGWSPHARLAGFGALGAVAAGICARVYLVDPAEPGHYPTCPFRMLTSWDCPGCGTLRGLHQLLHGNVVAAADRNLFFVIAAPLLGGAWVLAVAQLVGWRRRLPRPPARLLPVLPVLIIAFWIVRNLPVPVGGWLNSAT